MRPSVVLSCCLLLGCAKPEPRQMVLPVDVTVTDGQGNGLPGVALSLADRSLARTGADGKVRVQLAGPQGTRLTLGVRCPDNYRLKGSEPSLVLREYQNLAGEAGLALTVECARLLKTLALAVRASVVTRVGPVRAPGPAGPVVGLPLLMDGRQVAVTDENGVAHVSMRVLSGTKLDFVLGTEAPAFAGFQPHNPSHKIVVGEDDQLLGLDQAFLVEVTPRRPAPPHRITVLGDRQGEVKLAPPGR